ncbi:MAG: pilin [Congregibacter sp.]|nr:pilin [Congregibacter sp.]
MSEVLVTAAEAKTTISEYVAARGRFPTTAQQAGILENGFGAQSFVATAQFAGTDQTGVYTITASNTGAAVQQLGGAAGMVVTLSGTVQGNNRVSWVCAPANLALAKFLPASCRG